MTEADNMSVNNEGGKDRQRIPKLVSPEEARNLVKSMGQQVVEKMVKDGIAGSELGVDGFKKQEYCRWINGEVLSRLINEHDIPGMVFTMEPIEPSFFKRDSEGSWKFHSVGVLEIGAGEYVVYDITNRDGEEELVFWHGDLEFLTEKLDEKFGLFWNLGFVYDKEPNKSVVGKIENAKRMISSGRVVSFEDITFGDNMLGNERGSKPLGLKYAPMVNRDVFPMARAAVTYDYA